MIRPFTLITVLLAAGAGAYLFAVKHRAQVLDDQLAAVAGQSRQDGQRIRVLQAQWALEIDPTRLGQLAAQFTSLQPMQPAQLVTLAALQASLPPAGSPVPGRNPAGGAPQFTAGPVAAAAPALPLPPEPPPAPAVLASASSAPPTVLAVHPVARARVRTSLHFAAVAPPPVPLSRTMTSQTMTSQTMVSQTIVHEAPMGAQVMSVKAVSAPVDSSVASGSLLGMAAGAPPPQPLPLGGPAN